jgi:hypothetical protein
MRLRLNCLRKLIIIASRGSPIHNPGSLCEGMRPAHGDFSALQRRPRQRASVRSASVVLNRRGRDAGARAVAPSRPGYG